MLTATKTSMWSRRVAVLADGRPVATWSPSVWVTGGEMTLDGRQYRVRSGLLGSTFELEDEGGALVATARKVVRKQWGITAADGTSYEFRRSSMWSSQVDLLVGGQPVGYVRKAGFWHTGASAELPGLPLALQVFALAVVLTVWARKADAAA